MELHGFTNLESDKQIKTIKKKKKILQEDDEDLPIWSIFCKERRTKWYIYLIDDSFQVKESFPDATQIEEIISGKFFKLTFQERSPPKEFANRCVMLPGIERERKQNLEFGKRKSNNHPTLKMSQIVQLFQEVDDPKTFQYLQKSIFQYKFRKVPKPTQDDCLLRKRRVTFDEIDPSRLFSLAVVNEDDLTLEPYKKQFKTSVIDGHGSIIYNESFLHNQVGQKWLDITRILLESNVRELILPQELTIQKKLGSLEKFHGIISFLFFNLFSKKRK